MDVFGGFILKPPSQILHCVSANVILEQSEESFADTAFEDDTQAVFSIFDYLVLLSSASASLA